MKNKKKTFKKLVDFNFFLRGTFLFYSLFYYLLLGFPLLGLGD